MSKNESLWEHSSPFPGLKTGSPGGPALRPLTGPPVGRGGFHRSWTSGSAQSARFLTGAPCTRCMQICRAVRFLGPRRGALLQSPGRGGWHGLPAGVLSLPRTEAPSRSLRSGSMCCATSCAQDMLSQRVRGTHAVAAGERLAETDICRTPVPLWGPELPL